MIYMYIKISELLIIVGHCNAEVLQIHLVICANENYRHE
jgi:hypothetical protein